MRRRPSRRTLPRKHLAEQVPADTPLEMRLFESRTVHWEPDGPVAQDLCLSYRRSRFSTLGIEQICPITATAVGPISEADHEHTKNLSFRQNGRRSGG